jgi:hypothetical protein
VVSGARSPLPIPTPAGPRHTAITAPTIQASSLPPARKNSKDEPGGTDAKGGARGSGGHSGQQPSPGAKKPKHEAGGADSTDETNDSGFVAVVPNVGAPVPVVVAPVPDVSGRTLMWWRRSLMWSPQFRAW